MSPSHFLDTNILLATTIPGNPAKNAVNQYLDRNKDTTLLTSKRVEKEARNVARKYSAIGNPLAERLVVNRAKGLDVTQWKLQSAREVQNLIRARKDATRVEHVLRAYAKSIDDFYHGTLSEQELRNKLGKISKRILVGIRNQPHAVVLTHSYTLEADYPTEFAKLTDIIKDNADDVLVILGAHDLRARLGHNIEPFVTMDRKDFLNNASAIHKVIGPIKPLSP